VELIWTGVDKSVALNEGPAVIPADDDARAFPFGVVVGNEPGSADTGLVCPKNEPVCSVGGRLGRPIDNFWVAVTMVRSVDSNSSSTWAVSSSSTGVLRSLVLKLTGRLLRYTQRLSLLSYLISFPRKSAVPVNGSRLSTNP
jgi:hypothetical protein